MSKESVEKADAIVMEALVNGYASPSLDDNMVIKSRLKLFGYWENGLYFLNERGMEYAMKGCSKGIAARIQQQDNLERLNIDIQSFLKENQKSTHRLVVASFIVSFIALIRDTEFVQSLVRSFLSMLK